MAKIDLLTDQHMRVIAWVAPRVGEWVERLVPGIGIGLTRDGELYAGAVFSRITPTCADVHLAITGRRVTKDFLRLGFDYVFNQLKLRRVNAFVRADNLDCRSLMLHMGFRHEGRMRHVCADGADVIIYGLLREECRWVKQ
jgi:RimJ/RimL family protein N-acetyltransferase